MTAAGSLIGVKESSVSRITDTDAILPRSFDEQRRYAISLEGMAPTPRRLMFHWRPAAHPKIQEKVVQEFCKKKKRKLDFIL